jgi:hypothetical protein
MTTNTTTDGKQLLPRISDLVRALRDNQFLRIIEAIPIAEECFSAFSQTAAAQDVATIGKSIALVQLRTFALLAL